jgi:chromate reductase, NAD(P)H dehydrogenase (quinone)
MAQPKFRLLGLSGSIRQGSVNTAILRSLGERLGDAAELSVFPLNDVPMYNGDLESPALPEAVQALKDAISACDGMILCTPEFNHGIPGVLKNAIDWASRPAMASPLRGKPVLLMTSSPGFVGGARVHAQLVDCMTATLARVVVRPQVVIAGVLQKMADGRLVDETTLQFCLDAIDDLIKEIRLQAVAAA